MQALVTCASRVILALIQKCSQTTIHSSVVSITEGFGCLGCNLFIDCVEPTLLQFNWFVVLLTISCLFLTDCFYPPTTKPTNTFFFLDFQSSIYFPSSTAVHQSLTYNTVTRPCWIYQINIAPKPLTQIFPLGLSAVSSNLLPFAHLCPPLAQIQHPCQTWNTFPSLAAATTCDRSFSFYRWSIFKNLPSRAAKALTVVMSSGVQMLNWDCFSSWYIWGTNALQWM